MILLVMQARDNALRVRWTGRRLRTERGAGEPAPTWIPEANAVARLAAEAMGGLPGSGLNEVLLNRPFTAHILGGAPGLSRTSLAQRDKCLPGRSLGRAFLAIFLTWIKAPTAAFVA